MGNALKKAAHECETQAPRYEPTFKKKDNFIVLKYNISTNAISVVALAPTIIEATNLLNVSLDLLKKNDKRRKEDDVWNFYETVVENHTTYHVYEKLCGTVYSSKILKFIFYIKGMDDLEQ